MVILILFLCEVTFNPSTNYTVNLNLFQVYCSFVEKCLMDLKKNERMAPKKNKWRPSFRLFAFAIIDFPLFVLLSGVCSSGLRRVFMVGAFTGGMVPMHYTILVAFSYIVPSWSPLT